MPTSTSWKYEYIIILLFSKHKKIYMYTQTPRCSQSALWISAQSWANGRGMAAHPFCPLFTDTTRENWTEKTRLISFPDCSLTYCRCHAAIKSTRNYSFITFANLIPQTRRQRYYPRCERKYTYEKIWSVRQLLVLSLLALTSTTAQCPVLGRQMRKSVKSR